MTQEKPPLRASVLSRLTFRADGPSYREPKGGYTALVPALPGCVTYGRTVDEAREMAKDAISGYIASLRKHKDPIPTDDNTLVASLDQPFFHHKSSVQIVTDIEPTIGDNGDDL